MMSKQKTETKSHIIFKKNVTLKVDIELYILKCKLIK